MCTAQEMMMNAKPDKLVVKQTIKWSFEVPTYHLEDFQEDQDYLFALTHLCKSKPYVKFHRRSKLDKILDNSENELGKPVIGPSLVKNALKIGASAIIAPDHDFWSIAETAKAYEDTLRYANGTDLKIYAVVRNKKEFSVLLDIGATQTAIPYEYRFTCEKSLLHIINHWLGLNNPLEARIFQPSTIDTGMPIKLAIEGITIDSWIRSCCPHIHNINYKEYFSIKMSLPQIRLAKRNIKRLKEVCNA